MLTAAHVSISKSTYKQFDKHLNKLSSLNTVSTGDDMALLGATKANPFKLE